MPFHFFSFTVFYQWKFKIIWNQRRIGTKWAHSWWIWICWLQRRSCIHWICQRCSGTIVRFSVSSFFNIFREIVQNYNSILKQTSLEVLVEYHCTRLSQMITRFFRENEDVQYMRCFHEIFTENVCHVLHTQWDNFRNLLSLFFGKNFVKSTFLLKKLLRS